MLTHHSLVWWFLKIFLKQTGLKVSFSYLFFKLHVCLSSVQLWDNVFWPFNSCEWLKRMFPHNINTIVSRLVTGMKKITVWRLLVDPIPNSLNWHPKNFTADIKENYQKHLGIERVKKWHIVNKTVFSWYYVIWNVLSGFWWENLNWMSFTAFWMRLFSRYQPLKNLQLQGELWIRTGIVKGVCCCLWLHCCALIGLLLLLADCCAVKTVWTLSTELIM